MFGVIGDVYQMVLGSFEPDYDNLDSDTGTTGLLNVPGSSMAVPTLPIMRKSNPDSINTASTANNDARQTRSRSPASIRQRLSGRNDRRSNSRRRSTADIITHPD